MRGRGRFVDDLRLPGLLHLRVTRSIYARARVTGVRGASFDGASLRAVLPATGEGATGPMTGVTEPALAQGIVNYVGQPVAAVLAESAARAEDLAGAVEVEYEPLPPVPDLASARTAPPIHADLSSNVMAEYLLGAEFDRSEAPIEIRESFRIARVAANPLETRGAVARFDGGRLTLFASTQSVFSVRHGLAGALNLPAESVRVVQTDTGGAFGSKGSVYPEYVLLAHAAMTSGHPVKWVEHRLEHLTSSRHGRGAEASLTLRADRDGRIRSVEGEVDVDGGAYFAGLNASSPRFIGFQLTGPYGIPNAQVRARAYYTNRVPLGPYRGAGRPEAAFFMERLVDRLADELKLEPLEVRRRNATEAKFRSPLGLEVEASRPFLEEAVRELGYEGRRGPGVGLSFFVLVPAFGPGESCRLATRDGILHVWLGSHSHGQAHSVWVGSLLARELGLDPASVVLENPDTDELGEGIGTWGSRSAMVGAAALLRTAQQLKERVRSETGSYSVPALLEGKWDLRWFERQSGQMNSLGANLVAAHVEESGRVIVDEARAYYDVGHALNPPAVESQIIGGTLQAIGQTLVEEVAYDATGQVLTASLADAGVSTAVPGIPIVARWAEHPSTLPHGAKGVGESPTIGVPPALARAIETRTGIPITDLPVRMTLLTRSSRRR